MEMKMLHKKGEPEMEKYPTKFDEIIKDINYSRKTYVDIEKELSRLSEKEIQYISEFQENVRKLSREENLFITSQETRNALFKLIEMYKESDGFENSSLHKMLTDVIDELNEIEDMIKLNEPAKLKDEAEKRGIFYNYLLMIDMCLNNISKRKENQK